VVAGRSGSGWAGCIRSGFAAGSLADFGLGLDFVAGPDIRCSGFVEIVHSRIFLRFLQMVTSLRSLVLLELQTVQSHHDLHTGLDFLNR